MSSSSPELFNPNNLDQDVLSQAAVLVLGAGRSQQNVDKPNGSGIARAEAAIGFYNAFPETLLVSAGKANPSDTRAGSPEATALDVYLRDQGVPYSSRLVSPSGIDFATSIAGARVQLEEDWQTPPAIGIAMQEAFWPRVLRNAERIFPVPIFGIPAEAGHSTGGKPERDSLAADLFGRIVLRGIRPNMPSDGLAATVNRRAAFWWGLAQNGMKVVRMDMYRGDIS